ncbi:MAG TPA: gliding motility-associated C-terminal domain-containing protein [Chitinophagaceae bacterium]
MKKLLVLSLLLCLRLISGAQLCTGSLGDPVVHITFGSGNNPGPALAAATTNYGFVTNDCPSDGNYTVRNSSTNCFNATWHSLSQDHTTGDNNGYFMLVNASFQPGDFYVETVTGLCANTTYEFAAWIMNVLKPSACNGNGTGIDPNLTFKIETTSGATLATYNTGVLTEDAVPIWKQHGLFFQTPSATTTVVVRITNNAPGGCGNDLALDDITFRPCGPNVNASLAITGTTSTSVCEGDNTLFLINGAYPGGYNNPAYQWQVSNNGGNFQDIDGETSINYLRSPTGPGIYRYRLSMAESENMGSISCRIGSNIVTIEVNPLPVASMADTISGCAGTDILLTASGGSTYQWTGPNGFSSSASQPVLNAIDAADEGLYYVNVSTDKGCSVADSGYLVVKPKPNGSVTFDPAICEGASSSLQAIGGVSYSWSPAAGLSSTTISNPIASPTDTTRYVVKITNQFGCSDSIPLTVNVWKKPVANAGPDKITREGSPVVLTGAASGTDVTYYWTPPLGLNDPGALTPVALLMDDMTYTLNVVSGKGCGIGSDQVNVKVYKKVVIPNAFSPNNDGVNDVWHIPALQTYPSPEITVFNRYGQPVYRSKGYTIPWNGTHNGKRLPVGTYYYVVDLKIGEPAMSGWVVILY